MSLKSRMEERKSLERLEGIADRIERGAMQTKDGKRIVIEKPDKLGKSRYTATPRKVQAKLNAPSIMETLIKDSNFALTAGFYQNWKLGVIVLLQHIPEEEQDDQFREDVRNAEIVHEVPTGRYAGFGSQTFEIMQEYVEYNPFAVFGAIFNLMRRRGTVTLPKLWDEERVGVLFQRQGVNAPVERKK